MGTRSNQVVPFTVEGVGREVDGRDLVVRYLAADRIAAPVEPARDIEPFGRGRRGNQPDDRLVVAKGFSAPVGRDEGEQAVLDLVPLTRARWKVAHHDGEASL